MRSTSAARSPCAARSRRIAPMYGWSTCAAGNGLNDELRLSQCVPRPSVSRDRISRRRLDVLQVRGEQSPSPFEHLRRARRAGAREKRRRRCRSAPTIRDAGISSASRRPSIRGCPTRSCRRCRRPAPWPPRPVRSSLRGEIGHAERGKQPRRMEAAPVKLTRRDAADAARDLVADSDGSNQIAARDRASCRPARAPPPPTGCSCARSTRCACRRTRAPAKTRRSRTPPS